MKIVCDACQAKYSIADEKIQGKAFKIRCKKCNHIIVVKVGADGAAVVATSAAASADKPRTTGAHAAASGAAGAERARTTGAHAAAEASVWHVVIDGEQVGPLTEAEIRDRLRAGRINSDTLVWKEGFGDWTQFSTVPELTPLLARITRHPVAKPTAREPVHAGAQPAAAAPAAAAAAEADPFAAPTVVTPAGTADLFASSLGAQAVPAPVAPAPSSPFLFGGGPAQPAEPVVARPSGGNGAGTTHLTGQRNENSVLFSLANLEALAMPAQSSNIRSPSSSANTEGSGLIDIRSMAAMTLGDAPSAPGRSADALPTFSTPQFSPVAPVLLPMSTSGPPKWVYPVLALLGVAIVAVGITIYKVANKPPPGLPPPPPAPMAAPAPAGAPAPTAAPAAAAAKPAAAAEEPDKKTRPARGRSDRGRRRSGEDTSSRERASEGKRGAEAGGATASAATGSSSGAKPSGRRGGKSLDDLLGQVGSKKSGGGEEAPKPAVKLVTLTQRDIVTAMKGVQPKVQACANQFKVPGTAMATISVASGGKVSLAKVTGKFAGTPTGSCVEAAAKSARFPACQPMNFPWPFTLSPR
jgi:predicted Zn finger-like uncharacterized protein